MVVARASGALPAAHTLRLSSDTVEPLARHLARTKPQAIVNCAGRTSGEPAALLRANVEPVVALIEAMRLAALDARLVHLGSAAEYAEVTGRPTDEDAPVDPSSPYAAAKLAAFRQVNDAAESGLDAVAVRVFNPIGPGLPPTTLPGRAARLLREAATTGGAEVELGPLDAVRDYVDLRDIAAAVLLLATEPDLGHRIYNVGSGRPTLVRDLVGMLAGRVGFSGEIRETADGSPRSGGMGHQVADIARMRAIGWSPTVDLGASVDALVASLGADRSDR